MLLMAASILVFSILTSPTVVVLESYWLERHYRIVALLGLTVVLASAFAGLRISRQIASGRELMRDAAITLSLAVALPLVLYGVTYAACSIPTYCGA
jgi:glucose-6-phosphate-specific signal transduction histidine kinase